MILGLATTFLAPALGFTISLALGRRFALSRLEIAFFGFVCSAAYSIGLPVLLFLSPVLMLAALLTTFIFAFKLKSRSDRRPSNHGVAFAIGIVIILLIGGWLRLWSLGFSEFQGDEVRALRMAGDLPSAGLELLLRHKKGPAEILVPALGVMAGERSEFLIRFPFAFAGIGVVFGILLLGVRFFGPLAALVSALVLTLDGFAIAFSRIVQYQSIVLLFCVAAVYLTLSGAPLILVGLCAGLASLAHYDFIFCVPPILCVLAWRFWNERESWHMLLREVCMGAVAFAAVACPFYIPFVLHPNFQRTLNYVQKNRVGNSLLYNNLADFFTRISIYNSSYFAITLFILAAASLILTGKNKRARWFAAGTVAAILSVVAWPALWQLHRMPLALLPFLAAALLVFDPTRPIAWRAALLWFLGIFVTGAFLVDKPVTHFYPQVPALALLAGCGAAELYERLKLARRLPSLAVHSAAALLVVIFVYHQYIVFLRPAPAYWESYPAAKLRWYWTPFQSIPRNGYFGFPHRMGWHAVRRLVKEGQLPIKGLRTNADNTAFWYLPESRQAVAPEIFVYFRKSHAPAQSQAVLESQYGPLRSTISVQGEPKAFILSNLPLNLPAELAD